MSSSSMQSTAVVESLQGEEENPMYKRLLVNRPCCLKWTSNTGAQILLSVSLFARTGIRFDVRGIVDRRAPVSSTVPFVPERAPTGNGFMMDYDGLTKLIEAMQDLVQFYDSNCDYLAILHQDAQDKMQASIAGYQSKFQQQKRKLDGDETQTETQPMKQPTVEAAKHDDPTTSA